MTIPEVAIIDEGGNIAGHKPKHMLGRSDVYHGVFLLLITPSKKLILSRLADGHLSVSAMSICLKDETAEAAVARMVGAVQAGITPHHLSDQFYTSPEGRRMYMSMFYGVTDAGEPNDSFRLVAADEFERVRAVATPALQFIWDSYQQILPV